MSIKGKLALALDCNSYGNIDTGNGLVLTQLDGINFLSTGECVSLQIRLLVESQVD